MTSGPVPKRSTERRRRNIVPGETHVQLSDQVPVPRPPAKLHPMARRLYNSLAESGQAVFFEPSDWEVARIAAELTSRMFGPADAYIRKHWHSCDDQKCRCEEPWSNVDPRVVDSVFKLWNSLLVTESDRRRVRLEVERGVAEAEAGPTKIDEYKERLAK